MSTNENDDYELFIYYLKNGHLPKNDINNSKRREDNKENIKTTSNNKKEKYDDIEEYSLEKEEAIWLNYLKNANFSKYEKIVRRKRQTHNNTKKIKVEKIKPNAVLDLHGTKYKDAKKELDLFFRRYNYKNCNSVLIIHGKGYGSESGTSVLKILVEEYLIENKETYKIKRYIEAPNNLGGSGAKIVFFKG